MAMEKQLLIQLLQLRGFTHLWTKQGIKPLHEVPENILNGVYDSGKCYKRAKKKPQPKDKQLAFNFIK